MGVNFGTILFIFCGTLILVSIIYLINLERRLKKIFLGKKGNDLENTIISLGDEISKLKLAKENIQKEIREVNEKLKKSVRGLEIMRFNPFPDQGSNQSFAIGMLNEEGDGVVLSSLYSRERFSVFAKPVRSGKSEYELTAEEKEVLKRAEV
jgi:hypothetical protein